MCLQLNYFFHSTSLISVKIAALSSVSLLFSMARPQVIDEGCNPPSQEQQKFPYELTLLSPRRAGADSAFI